MLVIIKLVCLLLKYKKNGVFHMLKQVCLPQKKGKNRYAVHIKTSIFTTEIQKIGYAVNIKTGMFSTEKRQCCTLGIAKLVIPALKKLHDANLNYYIWM